jgi:hypothetical protein
LEEGGKKRTIAELLPAMAVTWRGSLGRALVVAADAVDADSTDTASRAGTVKISP